MHVYLFAFSCFKFSTKKTIRNLFSIKEFFSFFLIRRYVENCTSLLCFFFYLHAFLLRGRIFVNESDFHHSFHFLGRPHPLPTAKRQNPRPPPTLVYLLPHLGRSLSFRWRLPLKILNLFEDPHANQKIQTPLSRRRLSF